MGSMTAILVVIAIALLGLDSAVKKDVNGYKVGNVHYKTKKQN
jgi:hypothetical protein